MAVAGLIHAGGRVTWTVGVRQLLVDKISEEVLILFFHVFAMEMQGFGGGHTFGILLLALQ